MKLPIVGPSYQMDALSFGIQQSINFFPILSEVEGTKEVSALRSTPGYTLFATAGGGPSRGSISTAQVDRAFIVSGNEFYEISSSGVATLRGTLNTSVGSVGIAENGTQIMIVDGPNGYIFTLATNVFAIITDSNFPGATNVSFQDGFFLTIDPDTAKFRISALNDGLSWDPLDFTTVESNPDNLNSLVSDNGNVWLFGTRSVEVYQNQPVGTAFPFRRIPGAIIQTGCAATFTVAKFDNTVVWLGIDEQGRGVVWKASGYSAQRISTQAIEKIIDKATDFTDSYAWVYHEQGHIFYCLQVRSLNTTLVYDGATQQWHERQFEGNSQHKGQTHFFFAQRNLIGDRLDGSVYSMSLGEFSDNGTEIQRTRISQHFQEEKKLIVHGRLELDMEVGVGLVLAADQGFDPQISLEYSDDGGRTYSNQRFRSVGKIGEYSQRVIWNQLGMSRDRVYKISISEPVFVQINGAFLNGT